MVESCVGCGGTFAVMDGPIHRYMTSSAGCWLRYGELLGVLATRPEAQVARQLCVDAFAAQHPGSPNPQAIQSVAVHLLNMHDYFVRGRPVAPPHLAGNKAVFHWLTPPSFAGSRTVRDMPTAGTTDVLEAAAREWALSVWQAWGAQHRQVAAWAA
ncbi:MAG: DUF5946 family protein [Gemmatimonadaceae bacterium]